MAKYSDIKGFTVQTVSSDPIASQALGGAWASGGALNSERSQMAGVGSQTAALGFGGNTPGSPKSAANEQYNGSSWTELGDLNSARAGMYGFGTTTAAIGSGGLVYPFNPSNFATNLTESWNGSAWTETSDMTYGRATGGSATSGTSTAGLIFGGGYLSPSPNYALVAYTESWNGSGWTETADLNSARGYGMGGAGTQTSALAFGGNIPPSPPTTLIATESWDGSSWTEVNDMNTKREGVAGSGADNTSAIAVAGNVPPLTGITEIWNGTSWTEVADLSTARTSVGSAGTTVASLAFGGGVPGSSPSISTLTEEFTAPSTFTKQLEGQLFFNSTTNTFKETVKDATLGTWASGGTMNQARIYSLITSVSGGPSGQSDAFAVSGANPSTSNVANAETYNGSSWTEVGDVNSARRLGNGCGGQPAAVVAGGYTTGDVASTEVWNGSSWTETGDLNSAKRQFAGSFGTTDSSSDLLVAGAFPLTANTEIWDGSSWTETGNLNQQRYDGAGFGTSSTAGLIAGGQSSPSPIPGQTAYAENWNGSSWTEVAEFNTNRFYLAAAGEQTDGLIFGGSLDPGLSGTTEIWNGSSWTELNDMSAGVQGNGGGGSSVAAISFSGDIGPGAGGNTSEEFTAGLTNKTITAG